MRKINKKIEFKIAADGSSASGKTTGGKLIAKKLKMKFLSSGALYRFCALKTLENKNTYNVKFINKIANSITLKKLQNKKLYSPEVAKLSSIIAKKPYVRKALKGFQKNFIKKSKLVVVEGRDIGSKIMPNADLKLFFTCSTKEKAKRRLKEFKSLNKKITLKQVEKALIQRDKEDTKRKISPLIMTKNAVLVDTTKLTIKQMEAKLTNLVKNSIKKNMEIYKDLSSPASQQFEKLLNSQLSKNKIEEGKIIEGKITKITDKYVFLFIPGLKSEPVIDINEMKMIGMQDKVVEGAEVSVLLEKIEDKNGDVVVSAQKAQKIKGWYELEKAYEDNQSINGKITSKCKGGVIVEHIETGSLMFCPGSQISDKPMKSVDHLIGVEQKFAIIKLDKVRGNACVSRRQIVSSHKKEDKAKIIEKFKVGDIIKDAVVKGYSSFGCFFEVNNEIDVLVHLQEISYSRVNHPDEIFNIGEKHDLKVISIDMEKLQIGCSIKQLSPDPFEHISNYEIGKPYKVKVVKITDYGCFCELEPGLSTLLHSSEISWTKKNISPKKLFKVGDQIDCVITEIDKDKRRVAISHRLTNENPYTTLENKYPVGSDIDGVVTSANEYALYVKLGDFDIDGFLHSNDLSYSGKPEDELKKHKKGEKLKVRVLEIKKEEQKVRVGLKQLEKDPFDFFKGKKVNDIITVQVVSSDSKGLMVKPEGCDLEFLIKKSQIAVSAADARPSRFVGGERIDSAIAEINFDKRKVNLSIKLLEELQNKEAVDKFSSPLSGKNLPFSSLSEKLDDKKKKETE